MKQHYKIEKKHFAALFNKPAKSESEFHKLWSKVVPLDWIPKNYQFYLKDICEIEEVENSVTENRHFH